MHRNLTMECFQVNFSFKQFYPYAQNQMLLSLLRYANENSPSIHAV